MSIFKKLSLQNTTCITKNIVSVPYRYGIVLLIFYFIFILFFIVDVCALNDYLLTYLLTLLVTLLCHIIVIWKFCDVMWKIVTQLPSHGHGGYDSNRGPRCRKTQWWSNTWSPSLVVQPLQNAECRFMVYVLHSHCHTVTTGSSLRWCKC